MSNRIRQQYLSELYAEQVDLQAWMNNMNAFIANGEGEHLTSAEYRLMVGKQADGMRMYMEALEERIQLLLKSM